MVFKGPGMMKFMMCDLFSGNPGILCFPKGNEGFCTPRGALGTPTCENSNISIGFIGCHWLSIGPDRFYIGFTWFSIGWLILVSIGCTDFL